MSEASDSGLETIAPEHYRHVLGHFVTGVVAVTAIYEGAAVGFTCQSFSALSLCPPLVLICPSKGSTSWPKIAAVQRFAINVLAHDQAEIGRLFAISGADKFATVSWRPGVATGAPILADVVGWLECKLADLHEAGDHWIATAGVLGLAVDADKPPLTFFRGNLSGGLP
jgi:3-hydroxy-9,10-secoandrosta-1,3,5(10)-triene-9,17-dione monooxygenase reductase component